MPSFCYLVLTGSSQQTYNTAVHVVYTSWQNLETSVCTYRRPCMVTPCNNRHARHYGQNRGLVWKATQLNFRIWLLHDRTAQRNFGKNIGRIDQNSLTHNSVRAMHNDRSQLGEWPWRRAIDRRPTVARACAWSVRVRACTRISDRRRSICGTGSGGLGSRLVNTDTGSAGRRWTVGSFFLHMSLWWVGVYLNSNVVCDLSSCSALWTPT